GNLVPMPNHRRARNFHLLGDFSGSKTFHEPTENIPTPTFQAMTQQRYHLTRTHLRDHVSVPLGGFDAFICVLQFVTHSHPSRRPLRGVHTAPVSQIVLEMVLAALQVPATAVTRVAPYLEPDMNQAFLHQLLAHRRIALDFDDDSKQYPLYGRVLNISCRN